MEKAVEIKNPRRKRRGLAYLDRNFAAEKGEMVIVYGNILCGSNSIQAIWRFCTLREKRTRFYFFFVGQIGAPGYNLSSQWTINCSQSPLNYRPRWWHHRIRCQLGGSDRVGETRIVFERGATQICLYLTPCYVWHNCAVLGKQCLRLATDRNWWYDTASGKRQLRMVRSTERLRTNF